jgi:glutathione peroxidase
LIGCRCSASPRALSTPARRGAGDTIAGNALPGVDLESAMNTGIYDFSATSIEGRRADFASQRGKVLLIVNTASECGFTPQFAGLEQLWQDYRERGLVVIGFPSNEFGAQDPGSNEQIASFCQRNFGVSFPMMAKVKVNGSDADPLWRWLEAEAPGVLGSEAVKWNFTKFLVGRDGRVKRRYAPTETPQSLRKDIETALAE